MQRSGPLFSNVAARRAPAHRVGMHIACVRGAPPLPIVCILLQQALVRHLAIGKRRRIQTQSSEVAGVDIRNELHLT